MYECILAVSRTGCRFLSLFHSMHLIFNEIFLTYVWIPLSRFRLVFFFSVVILLCFGFAVRSFAGRVHSSIRWARCQTSKCTIVLLPCKTFQRSNISTLRTHTAMPSAALTRAAAFKRYKLINCNNASDLFTRFYFCFILACVISLLFLFLFFIPMSFGLCTVFFSALFGI